MKTPMKLPAPKLVTQADSLRRLARELLNEDVIAVDTESNSLYAYQEQVCLIQFSTRRADFLVDPLAIKDLSPLEQVFRSPGVEKIFHAAEYDLICLQRDFGFRLNNLFDTMIAARVLGQQKIGLGALLEEYFGVELDKRYQRANWGKRPLPSEQLTYAQLDTHFLIPLSAKLRKELEGQRRWPLAEEDFERMTKADYTPGQEDLKSACWKISGAHDLTAQQAAVLLELCRYRDQQARVKNRPLFKIIGDRTLLAIAGTLPRSSEALARLPGMSKGQMRRHGRALLAAVQHGLAAEPQQIPRNARPSEAYINRVEALRNWRKETGRRMGVNSDVVLARDLLYKVASENPQTMPELEKLLGEVPWRWKHFGDQIYAVLQANG